MVKFQGFNPDNIYTPREAAGDFPFAVQTLAKWRCLGSGPSYLKISGRIFYQGSVLNAWLASAERGGTPVPAEAA